MKDLQQLYNPQIVQLQETTPTLSQTEIIILILLGMGYSNHDLMSILDYSQRTIYKYRQLIAKQLNISSSMLEQYATHLIHSPHSTTSPMSVAAEHDKIRT
ncbi:MAG: hypothetical protein NC038_02170 [Paludibacter sp.]|nr:hypothetical protein [Bacteroidales bacterium]MCM1068481.1 hypothetical protein [Prevotella sp.]MCM1353435.1 hypothetical protein [Bacteroides sp.]MCM1442596.1 hypothetical protein [Muribaculum sp.]MCM1481441.1 hypothetical protein [Paludibacter sp.]